MTPVFQFNDKLCRVCMGVCRVPCTPKTQQRRGFAPSVQGVQGSTCAPARVSALRTSGKTNMGELTRTWLYPAHHAHLKKVFLNQWLKACMVVETRMHAGLHTLHTGFFGGSHG